MCARPSFDPGFSTEKLTTLFSAESTVAAMLEFEAALALALGDTGLAPMEEAEEVAAACRAGVDHAERILASTWERGTPLIELRESVTTTIGNEGSGKWFHYGATSQDAIDTGRMIQSRQALEIIDSDLISLAGALRGLTAQYRDQPQMGRTFLQAARPTTFGFRTATWLEVVLSHIEDLRQQRSGLTIQLGGPAGNLSDYGDAAPDVVASVARRLGLAEPRISWHASRERVTALGDAVARTATTMGKIGSDIALLASSDVAEIGVRSAGSSSMPEKQNPIDAIRAVAAARACSGAAAMLASSAGHELDRGVGGWHVEWVALPLLLQTAGAAVEAVHTAMASLQVDEEAMTANAGLDPPRVPVAQIDGVLARCDGLLGDNG